MFQFVKRFLEFLAASADLQRFRKWENDLEDALKQLEKKKKRISKKSYLQQKTALEKKSKKAEELIEKSQKRLKEARIRDVRL